MNTIWKTSFTVYPENCNYMFIDEKPMVHGGSMLLKMDRAAAECVRRLLYDSDCDSSRTVGVEKVNFFRGAKLGDLITIQCRIASLGIKRISVQIDCYIDGPNIEGDPLMALGLFNFCSFKNDKPYPHGMNKK